MILNLEVLQKVNEDRNTIQMGSKEVSQEWRQYRIKSKKKAAAAANYKHALYSGIV